MLLYSLKHSLLSQRDPCASPAFCEAFRDEHSLVRCAQKHGFDYFLNYYGQQAIKRHQFEVACGALDIPLSGRRLLDIGPGTGDSLCVARERGAVATFAVDVEPFFVRLALLRGHAAFLKDYRSRCVRGLYFPIEVRGVDVIWCKGALNCSQVNTSQRIGRQMFRDWLVGFDFTDWVAQAVALLNPGGVFVFVPAVDRRQTKIVDLHYPLETFHWIEDVDEWRRSFFADVLAQFGFKPVDNIPHLTHPRAFPMAWILRR